METALKQDIRKISGPDLAIMLKEWGEPAFKARQIQNWLWQKSCYSFDLMTNLSAQTRQLLNDKFEIRALTLSQSQISKDGTIKAAFRLYDNNVVEGVLIPASDNQRLTACISSQVGCSLTCKFCATGYMDRKRNLDAAEIYDQVVLLNGLAQKYYKKNLTNIVYMGMGEPLLNYAGLLESAYWITDEQGLNFANKRLTVSTAGIAKMIHKLAADKVKFNLALSLHAANDEKRNQIMPINQTNTLANLRIALQDFYKQTHNEITLEYITFNKFNDGPEDALELAALAKSLGVPLKINIIEYNPIAEADFERSEAGRLAHFKSILDNKGFLCYVRRSRGKDIDAACGQLANRNLNLEAKAK